MIDGGRRRWRHGAIGALALVTLVVAACSGTQGPDWTYGPLYTLPPEAAAASPGTSQEPSASPAPSGTAAPSQPSAQGPVITITAKSISFQPTHLQAPANVPFTIHFDNEDSGIPHDVTIRTGSVNGATVFAGDPITGVASTDYHVPALPPGTYTIVCTIHPSQMIASLTVT